MEMPLNEFKRRLALPDVTYGLFSGLVDPAAAEVIASAGFDWMLIDSEHAPHDLRSILAQLQAAAPYATPVLVRPEVGETVLIKRLLDIGVLTLLIPMVESAAHAARVVAATRYPPTGVRGVANIGEPRCAMGEDRWLPHACQRGDLRDLPDRDGHRYTGDRGHRRGRRRGCALHRPVRSCRVAGADRPTASPRRSRGGRRRDRRVVAAGKPVGVFATAPDLVERWTDLGVTFVAVGVDIPLLAKATSDLAATYKAGHADMRATVFGLGEAGSLFAAGLVAAGVEVAGYDPAPVVTPAGLTRFADPETAVADAELVLALTASADAEVALSQALEAIPGSALYADLATAAPALKRRLAAIAAGRGLEFVDIALLAIVPGRGLRTPALASGPGADRYVRTMTSFGVPVEAVGEQAGDASMRKLLRSVMMKGLASVVIEAMRAADAADLSEWLWSNLADEITAADEKMLARLVTGTGIHAERRLHEMEACQSLLEELGVDPVMTRSTVESLRRAQREGVPSPPT